MFNDIDVDAYSEQFSKEGFVSIPDILNKDTSIRLLRSFSEIP